MELDPTKLHQLAKDIQTAEEVDRAAAAAVEQAARNVSTANAEHAKTLADLKRSSSETFSRVNREQEIVLAIAAEAKDRLVAARDAMHKYISPPPAPAAE